MDDRSVAAGRYGLTVEQVSDQLAGNWLGEVATDLRLADRAMPGARAAARTRIRFDPQLAATDADSQRRGQADPVSAVAHMRARRTARASCCARTCGRWRSSPAASRGATWAAPSPRSARISTKLEAADRLHLRNRRPVSGAAAVVPRTADGVRACRRRSCSRSSSIQFRAWLRRRS